MLKADWIPYLHDFRIREFRLIFDRFGPESFEHVLELGAGDGFQSGMLVPYAKRLVSTDFHAPAEPPAGGVEVRALPAEQVAEVFGPHEFDLVFSSNMLEHVPDPQAVLTAVATVMTDDGVCIHVMPNRVYKLCQVLLWIPHLLAGALNDLITARSPRVVLDRLRRSASDAAPSDGGAEKNNPTVVRARRSLLAKILLPAPHGVSIRHGEEFRAFSRRRWVTELERAGFDVVAVFPGPFSSGYGFGVRSVVRRLERRGIASENVYVAKKAGHNSRYEDAFAGPHPRGTLA